MISDRKYDDIPTQMKNLNMVIPILMYFLTFTHRKQKVSKTSVDIADDNIYSYELSYPLGARIVQSVACLASNLPSGLRWFYGAFSCRIMPRNGKPPITRQSAS